ncbi:MULTISPECIES: uracil-xanthine permease family protein [unclassified Campylobacter]|uniref:uracil-xanthine permease family protein n=1 Tax=unclassified Campylobacter TaxID=2593542 RepID=UPI0022E9C4BA|nr:MULTISPECIES: uracil-xanthine permease family protein [unclassified Campylobacter]MDA3043732.1 uracil-xanthine permease family protein [Campylobacter sp. JMF_09 ED2]MDA3045317.1 uracil-xanthine permease family protein [Campylobacter sp. JMF_07 ED4]MDA3064503.1 uracil-xanthine permease family protein [Campylobacter sp. JMF_11 EL3]MDA3072196.1 uracil-xanthine permease family protein [Campylobacter sp. VBCF_03 NA9]MDA3075599.1 uracil-xanthine permease family protein [Campylobacter sp. JMF_05 E
MAERYEGYNFRLKDSLLGVQFLFVAFGALVLVPILTGLDTNVALFTAGIGTLVFQLCTRKQVVPIFLASSFAFITPITFSVSQWGVSATMGGLMAAGLLYVALSFVVRYKGDGFIHKLLPPVVVGPVIIAIGLILSPTAVNMAMAKDIDAIPQTTALIIAFISLIATIIAIMFGKGIIRLIPILSGIFVGYIASLCFGIVDFSPISNAKWFSVPNFSAPSFNLNAILYMLPIAIAPTIEHIGDILTISNVTKENFLKNPGLKSTLLGDGLATTAAACFGGPPNTTYSEVTGAVRLTKAFNPAIMTWTAITAILLAFVGKLGAFIATIPVPVIGGIMILLFGIIASVGMESLIKAKVDLSNPRNMVIISLILVVSIGGLVLDFSFAKFSGIGLGAIVGVVLNLVLPKVDKIEEMDFEQLESDEE